MKKFLALTVFAGFVGFATAPAHAALSLMVGGTTITDNDANDVNSTAGAITYVGATPNFSISVNTGIVTSLPSLDLSNVLGTSSGQGTLVVKLTMTDLTSPAGLSAWLTQFSGNFSGGSGTVHAQTYIDTSNTAFGTGTALGDLTASTTPFGLASTNNGGGTTPFSLTEILTITANGAGRTFSLDTQLSSNPVPEPASLSILGASLAGIGMIRRRKARV